MDVSIIVVNYNTAGVVLDCINSVRRQISVEYEVIIVDNASSDNSSTLLAPLSTSKNIHVVLNDENIGFGRANNQAFRQSSGRYIFLLNPDAALLASNDLQRLVAFMDENSQCGLAGTRIFRDDAGRESQPFLHYPGEKSLQQPLSPLPGSIAWVLGASMIIRRDVYESVGGFDEDYFLYAEEADLCLRIREHGYQIGQCKDVAVEHIGGVSESAAPKGHVQRKKQAALYLFYKKHYPSGEIARLVRRDRLRALMHLLPLRVQKISGHLGEQQLLRYQKYQAINETARAFLKAEASRNHPLEISVL